MLFDRGDPCACEPVGSSRREGSEEDGGVLGAGDPEPSGGFALADLHTDVGPLEGLEGELVGDVVAHVQHCGAADVGTHRVERPPLVGRDEQQLTDLLAVADGEFADVGGDGVEHGDDLLDLGLVGDGSIVHGDRCRLLLE